MQISKRIFAFFLSVVLLAVTVFGTSAYSVESSIITNSSFETGDGWNYGGIFRTNDKAHTGNYSVKTNVRGNAVAICPSKQLSIKPNTDYLLSGYVYRQDNSTWGYIDLNDMTSEIQLLNTDTYGEWVHLSGVWNSGSNTNVTVRLVVEPNYTINQHLKEGVTGDVWFDDVEFSPIDYGKYSEDIPSLSNLKKDYVLENSDIKTQITTDNNKEFLTKFENKENGISFINSVSNVPLVQPVSGATLNWVLTDVIKDTDKALSGTGKDVFNQYVFVYKSESPKLTLKTYYRIYPSGPLYHFSEIINNTGKDFVFNASDISCADVLFKVPQNAEVYRFNRSRYNNGADGLFTTGVLKSNVTENMFLKSKVENSWLLSSGELPFEIIHSGNRGMYIGYEWSYGEMLLQTQSNKNLMKFSASLGFSSDTIKRENNEVLTIPPVFFGLYEGSVDDGSNNMKKWFYNHLMTQTLRENQNEPYIEFHLPLFSEGDLKNYINSNDLSKYGVEMTKMDYWWTVPNDQFDSVLEQTWNPDKNKWPNGMTYGKLVKEKFPSMKTSLYMCDTYNGVDIGTKSGQKAQIDALQQRMDNWKIDCWRSDFDLLKPNNYQNHEGLMNILDTMIANNSNFRYEHCSAGGSLKDFSTLQRMSFMTMEDSGGALNHRMAFYSNSYMINPVQLKFDIGFDWTSPEDSSYISNNQSKWTTYNVRTAMLGAMMVQNVSGWLSDIQKSELIKGWELYKTKQRPILKGADVYHILPMPDGKNWDGIEFYNKDIEKGSVFLFRDKNKNATDGSSKNIKLMGLSDNAQYKIEFQDRTSQNTQKSGYELRQNGITVTGMNSVYDSEIIWIEKIGDIEPTSAQTEQTEEPTQQTEPSTSPQTQVLIGDVDLDKSVTIVDATKIQKAIAKIIELDSIQTVAADTNDDTLVSIFDATCIQRYLAKFDSGVGICGTYKSISAEPTDTTTEPITESKTEEKTESETEKEGMYTMLFKNTQSFSGTIRCYFWADGNTGMTSWPGETMELIGQDDGYDVYRIYIPDSAQYVIFTNGNEQTVDIPISGSSRFLAEPSQSNPYQVSTW